MSGRLPDFIVIGAMKSGTSTLHEQLALRPGLHLSTPKEPNFFSDDPVWERGLDWYRGLFAAASETQRCGESSTHYTKLPTYPECAERMRRQLADVRLVYVMRDPLERIASQYVHEWTQREVSLPIDEAVQRHERFAAYSCYARQLEPYLEAYGPERVLPVAFERMLSEPDAEFARICAFIGDPSGTPPRWSEQLEARNRSAERLRRSALREWLRSIPALRALAEKLPAALREAARAPWQLRRRPELGAAARERLEASIDADLARLSSWLDRPLRCASWRQEVLGAPLAWSAATPRPAAPDRPEAAAPPAVSGDLDT